jgi:hypothetical protein
LRKYSFSFDELAKRITLKAEVERDLTEDERESLAVVGTEVYSGMIFGNDTIVEAEISVVHDGNTTRSIGGGHNSSTQPQRAMITGRRAVHGACQTSTEPAIAPPSPATPALA